MLGIRRARSAPPWLPPPPPWAAGEVGCERRESGHWEVLTFPTLTYIPAAGRAHAQAQLLLWGCAGWESPWGGGEGGGADMGVQEGPGGGWQRAAGVGWNSCLSWLRSDRASQCYILTKPALEAGANTPWLSWSFSAGHQHRTGNLLCSPHGHPAALQSSSLWWPCASLRSARWAPAASPC